MKAHEQQRSPRLQRVRFALCIVLAAIVWAIFGQTLRHDFINYDDDLYLHGHAQVTAGLTWQGAQWAFRSTHAGNWHPLTTLSHMLDVQMFGRAPWGHHLVNVLLHGAATIALFLALERMTGAIWQSGLVAALFAVHPLRVESVAWVAERKDVLSACFFGLTLCAYAAYARRRTAVRYLVVCALVLLGLLSKAMLVTLPLILLLLDHWPLARTESWARRCLEKIPLFILAALVGAATWSVQRGTMSSFAQLPLLARVGNAALSMLIYLRQSIWPVELVPFYPHAETSLPVWVGLTATLVLVCFTAVALWLWWRMPPIAVGWFWYAAMLVPVLGLVQVGLQAHADRYTYLPQVGLWIALVWGISAAAAHAPRIRKVAAVSGLAAVVLLALRAHAQTRHWRDSATLWNYTLAVQPHNPVALTSLANLLPATQAIPLYERALAQAPRSLYTLNNLAWILATSPSVKQRDGARAVELAERAVNISGGNDAAVARTLAVAYAEAGRWAEAIATARRALEIAEPQSALAEDLRQHIAGFQARRPVRDLSLEEEPSSR